MSAANIVSILKTTRDHAECVFEVELTGAMSVADGAVQVEVRVVQLGGATYWADVVSPTGAVMVRPPRAGDAGVAFAPLGDVSNLYFLGYIPLNAQDNAAPADELFLQLEQGQGWRVKTVGGAIVLEATGTTPGSGATLTLYPDGRFELVTGAGSYLRGGAGGTLDLGGTAGSLVQLVSDLITAITTATVPIGNPGSVSAVVNPQFASIAAQLAALKG